MASAANEQAYGQQAWGKQPWGAPPPNGGWQQPGWNMGWQEAPFWHPFGLSRPVGIAVMILGFILWWPVGLAILFGMIWSGRMGCWGRRRRMAYQNNAYQNGADQTGANQTGGWQQGAAPWASWRTWCGPQQQQQAPTSGNRAFDEYRAETLRRLEDEQKEFGSFLDRLRFAKDKAEFDQFMAERRQRPPQPPTAPEGDGAQA